MKIIYLLFTLVLVVCADDVSGHLYDLLTGEPLSDVQVRLGGGQTVTDDDGNFAIAGEFNQPLRIETEGYAPVTVPAPVPTTLNIVMLPNASNPSKPYKTFFDRLINTAALADAHEQAQAVWRAWHFPIPVQIDLGGDDAKEQNAREAVRAALNDWEINLGMRLFQVLGEGEKLGDYGILITWGGAGLMESRNHPRIEYTVNGGWSAVLPVGTERRLARITVVDRQGYYDPRNAMLWALGRVLVGGPADPHLWNPPDAKSILRLPLSIYETEGNLTATAKDISPDDAAAFRYLIHLPDETNLSYYFYRNPAKERNRISEGFHGSFGMGVGGGYFARDHWRRVWQQKTGESGPTAVVFPARLLAGISWWRLGLDGEVTGASPIGAQDVQIISGKPNRAHYSAMYCARGDVGVSVSPWRDYADLGLHGGTAYLTYEVGGYPKYVDEENAVATRNSSYTYGAELTVKPFGPHYNVAQGFCIPIPPDLVVDYTVFANVKNTSILKVMLGSLVYPTRASGFPPTELFLFAEQYRNQGSWANLFGFQFATYIFH
jgi:hypothetical protein